LAALDQTNTTEQQIGASYRGWQGCAYLCHQGFPYFLFQERDLSSPALVRIADEPLMGFEDSTFDRVHGTPAHTFEPDRFEPTHRVHTVPDNLGTFSLNQRRGHWFSFMGTVLPFEIIASAI